LALIKRPKSFGFEFKGAGDVQAVECSNAEFGAVVSGQLGADVEGVLRHGGIKPQSAIAVVLESEVDPLRIGGRHLSSKNLPRKRMGPLGENEWCHIDLRPLAQKYVSGD
jgi:hypothetical protein